MYQVPVSIADLGGTEIDLRFANSKEGRLFVIVAPVLRFADSKKLTRRQELEIKCSSEVGFLYENIFTLSGCCCDVQILGMMLKLKK